MRSHSRHRGERFLRPQRALAEALLDETKRSMVAAAAVGARRSSRLDIRVFVSVYDALTEAREGGTIDAVRVASCLATAQSATVLLDQPHGRAETARAIVDGDRASRTALEKVSHELDVEQLDALGVAVGEQLAGQRIVRDEHLSALSAIDRSLYHSCAMELADRLSDLDDLGGRLELRARLRLLGELQSQRVLVPEAFEKLLDIPEAGLGALVIDAEIQTAVKTLAIIPQLIEGRAEDPARHLLRMDPAIAGDFALAGVSGATLARLMRGLEGRRAASAALNVAQSRDLSAHELVEVVRAALHQIPRPDRLAFLVAPLATGPHGEAVFDEPEFIAIANDLVLTSIEQALSSGAEIAKSDLSVLGVIPTPEASILLALLESLHRTFGYGIQARHGSVARALDEAAQLPDHERRVALEAVFSAAAPTCDEPAALDLLVGRTVGESQGWKGVNRFLRPALSSRARLKAQVLLAARAATVAGDCVKLRSSRQSGQEEWEKDTAERLARTLKQTLSPTTTEDIVQHIDARAGRKWWSSVPGPDTKWGRK